MVGLAACSTNKPEVPAGFVKRTVNLINRKYVPAPEGRVTLLVPNRYDTLLVWVDLSDSQGSHIPKYRFVNSKACLLQESGFFKREGTYCKDTLDRLTIETRLGFNEDIKLTDLKRQIAEQDYAFKIMGRIATVWKARKIEVINGRTFGIVESFGSGPLVMEPYNQVVASTEFGQGRQRWELVLRFECKNKDCKRFAMAANTILHSVRVDTLVGQSRIRL